VIINAANLQLASAHQASDTTISRTSLRAWIDGRPTGAGDPASDVGTTGGARLDMQSASVERATTAEISAVAQALNAGALNAGAAGSVAVPGACPAASRGTGPGSACTTTGGDALTAAAERAAGLFDDLDAAAAAAARATLHDIAVIRSGPLARLARLAAAAGDPTRTPRSVSPSTSVDRTSAMEGPEADALEPTTHDPNLLALIALVEHLTGRPVRLLRARDVHGHLDNASRRELADAVRAAMAARPRGNGEAPRAGYGIALDTHAEHHEVEVTTVAVRGTIQTADGRQIDVALDLAMSRRTAEVLDSHLRAGDAKLVDPLVIDLAPGAAAAPGAGLVSATFNFDLNGDGATEQIHQLAAGSGFLVVDRNGNGQIDDGSELFGPATGSGFGELAAADADANGWIDERDPIFARLAVWQPAAEGSGALTSLAQAGVGAISTTNVASPFAAHDPATDALAGQVAATGIYVAESGAVGTVRQVDFTV
jgi:hypothetical protein